MQARVNFLVSLPFAVKREGVHFVACCPPLDLFTQGNTKKRAVENLTEAIQLFLISCYERGTLDQALRECGFEPAKGLKVRATPSRRSLPTLTVPLPFVIQRSREELCLD